MRPVFIVEPRGKRYAVACFISVEQFDGRRINEGEDCFFVVSARSPTEAMARAVERYHSETFE